MHRGFFLNVVCRQQGPALQLLPSENQSLLISRHTFSILYHEFDVIDDVAVVQAQGDRLPPRRLHKDLYVSEIAVLEQAAGLPPRANRASKPAAAVASQASEPLLAHDVC